MSGLRTRRRQAAWASEGLTFYLQDVTDGYPLTSDYTLATLAVHLQTQVKLRSGDRWELWVAGASALSLVGLILWRPRRWRAASGGAALLAGILFRLSSF